MSKLDERVSRMNPDATLQLVLEAYWSGDLDTLSQHASDLDEWLFRGNTPPEIERDKLMTIFAALSELAQLAHSNGLTTFRPDARR
jgi:hypothetical protein